MRSTTNFHGSDEQHKQSIERSVNKVLLSYENVALLKEYAKMILTKVSAPRASAIVSRLCKVHKHQAEPEEKLLPREISDYVSFTSKDYQAVMDGIRNTQDFSESYKQDLSRDFKRYVLWLKEMGTLVKVSQKVIDETKCVVAKPQQKDDSVVMSDEEIDAFIFTETNPKYRCFFAVLADSGCRPAELSTLRWEDIRDVNGSMGLCITQYKGGKAKRFVPLSDKASGFLMAYKQFCGSLSGYVYPSQRGETLSYRAIYNEFNRVMKELGWEDKPYTLYSFRHSRITKAVRSDVNLEVAKRVFWGNGKTQMLDTYTHLSADDLVNGMKGH